MLTAFLLDDVRAFTGSQEKLCDVCGPQSRVVVALVLQINFISSLM